MSAVTVAADRFDNLYKDVKGYVDTFKRGFDMDSVTSIVHYAMTAVQTGVEFKNMSGMEKKDFVIAVATDIVQDVLDDPEVGGKLAPEARTGITVALAGVPMIIDMAVNFAKVYSNDSAGSNGAVVGDSGVAKGGCFCC
jgi:hypothetical protein